jgi:hypothetical protein
MVRVLRDIFCVVGVLLFMNSVSWRTAHAQDDGSWLLAQVNNLRASQGLPAYAPNAQLSAAATQQSQYLARTCNVVHTWPDGTSPQSRAAAQGYTGDHVIENIFAGSNATAADAWNFWMTSPIHYNSLVNTLVTEIGIGSAHGGLCGHAYTLVFGRAGDGGTAPSAPPANPVAAAPPPTQRPYVPPPPSPTPTATIPTLTPSATWTLTPSYTPSPTFTAISPTATPLELPTVPVQPVEATAVAVVPSPTATEAASAPVVAPPSPTPAVHQAVVSPHEDGFELRNLIPFALVGQIVLIGIAGFVYFRKAR